MTRKITAEALEKIKQFEGLRLEAYMCSAGVWTIGYGHTGDVKKGDKITESKAEDLLIEDIARFESRVQELVKVELSNWQFAALVSFDFNTGALHKSTLLKKLNKRDYNAVPAELMKWTKAKDPKTGKLVVLQGLVNRRAAEAGMWAKGEFVQSSTTVAVSVEKPLMQSKTMAGSGVAGIMVTGTAILNETKEQLMPLVPYADTIKTVFLAVALAGIGLTIYARIMRNR